MFRKNTEPLSQVLQAFFKANPHLKARFEEHLIMKAWDDLMGERFSAYVKHTSFRYGVLHVQVTSSVLRSELVHQKGELIQKLNSMANTSILKEIVIR